VASPRTAVLAAAIAGAALLAAGCANIPTVGVPQKVTGEAGQAPAYVQPIPPHPGRDWNPLDVVHGFLAASASFTHKFAAARQFLAPPLNRIWQPIQGVTVVSSESQLQTQRVGPASIKGASNLTKIVTLTGNQLATINNIGQYLDNPAPQHYSFRLARVGGRWLITDLPQVSSLLLSQSDFEEVYQPRNLYFWSALGGGGVLVPEPVFAPEEDTYASVASYLVNGLLRSAQDQNLSPGQDQTNWLASATTSGFPRGTTMAAPVSIANSVATVSLSGAAAGVSGPQLSEMVAQLVTTLTSTSYGQPAIARSVVLKINGRVQSINGQVVQTPSHYQASLPDITQGKATLYYLGPSGVVMQLPYGESTGRPVTGPAGSGQVPFSRIAVSPSGDEFAATLATGRGCTVYYGFLGSTSPLVRRVLPDPSAGPCTSLSWDRLGDIWAVAGQNIWVMPPGARQPVAISPPPLPGNLTTSYQVLALRVAPDGVRAAMLVQVTGGVRMLVLTAVSRSGAEITFGDAVTIGGGVAHPQALGWYDPDHLVVLAQSQLYEVPASGGASTALGPVPTGTASVSAAGPAQVTTGSQAQILVSAGPDALAQITLNGTSPVYPG
jgi:hypothetical protein